jgi:hypothetical protein
MSKNETKLYYPYKDHILASNIIGILALNPEISNKRIGVLLLNIKKSATPPAIKVALQRLVDTDYVIKKSTVHKTQTDNIWELSCVGKLVSLTILNKNELESFVKTEHEVFENKFYAMIDVLINNSKREFVRLLIDRLNKIKYNRLQIERTAIDWYNDMRLKISNMNTANYPKLALLQNKIKQDGFKPINLTNRGFIIDPLLTSTIIDRIC